MILIDGYHLEMRLAALILLLLTNSYYEFIRVFYLSASEKKHSTSCLGYCDLFS
jgi:hypothetical protein